MTFQINYFLNASAHDFIDDGITYEAKVLGMVIGMLCALPFLFFASILIRRQYFAFRMTMIPGIFLYIATAYVCIKSLYKYFIFPVRLHHNSIDTYTKLSYLPTEIGFISRIYYFKSILVILTYFKVPGTVFMNFLANLLRYFGLFVICVWIVISYVEIPPSMSKFISLSTTLIDKFILDFELVFNCICFIILSISFIFSRVGTYLPSNMRKMMKIGIFMFPLSIIISKIAYVIFRSRMFYLWGRGHKQMYSYLYMSLFLIYKFIDFHAIIFIVWILSVQDFTTSSATTDSNEKMILII